MQNDNGTLTYSLKKIYVFREELSVGSDDDVVIVPNIPMLSATSQSKHAARWVSTVARMNSLITLDIFFSDFYA